MEGGLQWKKVILSVGIALSVIVLLFAVAYFSSRVRLVEPPPAVARPRVEVPAAELKNVAAAEARMRELWSGEAARAAGVAAESAALAPAARVREIQEDAARRLPAPTPSGNLPGGVFNF